MTVVVRLATIRFVTHVGQHNCLLALGTFLFRESVPSTSSFFSPCILANASAYYRLDVFYFRCSLISLSPSCELPQRSYLSVSVWFHNTHMLTDTPTDTNQKPIHARSNSSEFVSHFIDVHIWQASPLLHARQLAYPMELTHRLCI